MLAISQKAIPLKKVGAASRPRSRSGWGLLVRLAPRGLSKGAGPRRLIS